MPVSQDPLSENPQHPAILIAEAGVNHNGDVKTAIEMINAAADAGADYVKFQTFSADRLVVKDAPKAGYQKKGSGDSESQLEMLKNLELSESEHRILIDHCDKAGIKFLSTPFDLESIDLLLDLEVHLLKVPSGEITNFPFLRKVASSGLPVIMSTGMSDLEEIKAAIQVLEEYGTSKEMITVLHCNTQYPTPVIDVHLKAMKLIEKTFNVQVGYSDHTLGIEIAIAAVSLGASVIEKHFTLSRSMAGPDHAASLEPNELAQMVKSIRNVESAMGRYDKMVTPSELPNREIARKSIFISRDLEAGHVIQEDDLLALRPGTGLSPMFWNDVIGKKIRVSLTKETMLSLDHLEA